MLESVVMKFVAVDGSRSLRVGWRRDIVWPHKSFERLSPHVASPNVELALGKLCLEVDGALPALAANLPAVVADVV